MNIIPELSVRTFSMLFSSTSDAFVVSRTHLPRVLFHALILSVIIAGFWLLDSLKDPILANFVGLEYQPMAKFFSVCVTLIVVCIYDYLTSCVSKPTLFYLVSGFFGICFLIISALLSDPVQGLENKIKHPHRLIGWFSYFAIESYGSLMVALFWSFTNSNMNLEQAKGGYGLIISFAQLGAILGSTIATKSLYYKIPMLYFIGSILVLSIGLLIKVYYLVFRDHATVTHRSRLRSYSGASSSADIRHFEIDDRVKSPMYMRRVEKVTIGGYWAHCTRVFGKWKLNLYFSK